MPSYFVTGRVIKYQSQGEGETSSKRERVEPSSFSHVRRCGKEGLASEFHESDKWPYLYDVRTEGEGGGLAKT